MPAHPDGPPQKHYELTDMLEVDLTTTQGGTVLVVPPASRTGAPESPTVISQAPPASDVPTLPVALHAPVVEPARVVLRPETLPAAYAVTPRHGAVRPFHFPSLQHLDQRIDDARSDAVRLFGLSTRYADAMREAYRSFRCFLVETKADQLFIRDEFEVQQLLLLKWVGWLTDRGRERNCINTYWRSLRAVVRTINAVDHRSDIFAELETPRPATGRIVRCIPHSSAEDLLRYVKEADWRSPYERAQKLALLVLFMPGGLRLEDVLDLRCADVDIENAVIHIRDGKGRDGGKDRDVCMTPEMHAALSAYLVARRRAGKTTAHFLASVGKDEKIGVSTVRRFCKKVGIATGIKFTPHPLRHTSVNELLAKGVNGPTIRDQMGWTSVRMLDRYAHVATDERARAMQRVIIDATFRVSGG